MSETGELKMRTFQKSGASLSVGDRVILERDGDTVNGIVDKLVKIDGKIQIELTFADNIFIVDKL